MSNSSETFLHPGLLHTESDFAYVKNKVDAGLEPWTSGYEILTNNSHSALNYESRPQAIVYRGYDGTHSENYRLLYNDAAAAYALALRWKISGDDSYANASIQILNGWAQTLTAIEGTSDKFLASGLYGYQIANAAEIMRSYSKWSTEELKAFQTMMLNVFYPMNHRFLVNHNDAKIDHYWANWDLANMAAMLAIGVLTDRADIYDEAVEYFKHGGGNGAIDKLVWIIYEDGLSQTQESGRDQGHNTLCMALVSTFCQMAYNQECDLFAYDNNRVLSGAEYVAQYNLGNDVPYTTYQNSDVVQTVISSNSRGNIRPAWELLYNQFVIKKGLSAPGVEAWAAKVRPEGGGGNYGPNSGGYDQLGYGTLMFSTEASSDAKSSDKASGSDDIVLVEGSGSEDEVEGEADDNTDDTASKEGLESDGDEILESEAPSSSASAEESPSLTPAPSVKTCGVRRRSRF